MRRSETMSFARRRATAQSGQTLVATLGVITMLGVLVVAGLNIASSTATGSASKAREGSAIQAADAAVNRYISRLVEDPDYPAHFVDQAEDSRIRAAGQVVPAGADWRLNGSEPTWTYAGAPSQWVTTGSGKYGSVRYSLRVTPPPIGSDTVTITATGQVGGDRPNPVSRTVQAQVRPSSISDFQLIADDTVTYGAAATTTGKIYSNNNLQHFGLALAPAYARNLVCAGSCGSSSNTNPAIFKKGAYASDTNPNFTTFFPTPINFSRFTQDLTNVRDSAAASGSRFNDATANAWLVQFLSNGTYNVWKITGNPNLNFSTGTTTLFASATIPATGAMYFDQPVIIGDNTKGINSVVNGRITLASPAEVYVGGNVNVADATDDVLGAISNNNVTFTTLLPDTTFVQMSLVAQRGWMQAATDPVGGSSHCNVAGSKSSLTLRGSQTSISGCMSSQYASRTYEWDPALKYLRPPLFPIIEGSWETLYWREVNTPS